MNRASLAKKYLRGHGVEIGALNVPWPNPMGARITYVDEYSLGELQQQYPEARGIVKCFKDPRLLMIGAGSLDFIVSSHVFEHLRNPLFSLATWMTCLRPGGVVVMAIPEMTRTFDKGREETPFAHLEEDYETPDPHGGEPDAHFHCWTAGGLRASLVQAGNFLGSFSLVEFAFVDFECFVVLEKKR